MKNPYIWIAIGLAAVGVYPDLVGHGTAFIASNALIETQYGVNGRFLFSIGLFTFSLIAVLFTSTLRKHERILSIIFPLASLPVIAIYTLAPLAHGNLSGILAASGAFSIGFTYGWVETYMILMLFYSETIRRMIWTLLASFILKSCFTRIAGTLNPDGQITILYLTPLVLLAATLFLYSWAHIESYTDNEPYKKLVLKDRISQSNTKLLFIILIACSAFESVARGLSTLGFWGIANIIDGNNLLAFFLVTVAFLLITYLVFLLPKEDNTDVIFSMGIIVLLSGLIFLEAAKQFDIYPGTGFITSFGELVELYANEFWIILIISVIRETSIHPYRVTGIAEMALSFTAAGLSIPLRGLAGFDSVVVTATSYITIIIAFSLFIYGRKKSSIQKLQIIDKNMEQRTESIGKEYNLSPRENEVFLMLAQGRSRKFIQDTLFLSESTIKTHTQSIYRKLGIHSKQELIEMAHEILESDAPSK